MDPERFGFDADENIYFDRTMPVQVSHIAGDIQFEETTIGEVVEAYQAAAARIAELEREKRTLLNSVAYLEGKWEAEIASLREQLAEAEARLTAFGQRAAVRSLTEHVERAEADRPQAQADAYLLGLNAGKAKAEARVADILDHLAGATGLTPGDQAKIDAALDAARGGEEE